MPSDTYPGGFDPNFDMNVIGPVPRPDGSILPVGAQQMLNKPSSNGESRASSFPANTYLQDSQQSSSGIANGLDEGYNFRTGDAFQPLNLAQSADAETQTALEGLFSGPLGQVDSRGDTQSPDPNLDPALINSDGPEGNAEKKRKQGTSRINMLARGGACEFCKKRKLKCTAEEPSCATCVRIGRECVYSQKKQRSKVRQLEDRLAELEKVLHDTRTASVPHEATHADTFNVSSTGGAGDAGNAELDEFWDRFAHIHRTSAEGGFTFPRDTGLSNVNIGVDQSMEATLMTLADAAASDVDLSASQAWEGMSEVEIASEIVKAVEGIKGVGEKLVGHLLQLYVNPQIPASLHHIVNPASFVSRLLPHSPSPPHPALMLALMPYLLPLSPSPALSNPERYRKICSKIDTPARLHAQHALSVADPRLLDIVAANTIRRLWCTENGRLVEAWVESNSSVALAWATGLGKLGGVGETFLSTPPSDPASVHRREREAKIRDVRYKGTLVEPPRTAKEYGQRVHLFWQVYMLDKGPSIGWGFASSIVDEEITTPFPHDGYDRTDALKDNTTLNDLLCGRAYTGTTDSDYCAFIKALCLYHRATRLFDTSSLVASPENTSQLKNVTLGYMKSLPLIKPIIGQKAGTKSQSWQMLHSAMFYLYLKEEVDLPSSAPTERSLELIDNAILSAERIIEAIETMYLTGSMELEGLEAGPGAWGPVGRATYRLAERLEREGRDDGRSARLRQVGQKLKEACETVGKRMPVGKVIAQKLENNSKGADEAVGMWQRIDTSG